jgi:release factor glutamine methyltransferase
VTRKVGEEIARGIAVLKEAAIASPERDARLLMSLALGIPRDRMTLHLNDLLSDATGDLFRQHLKGRAAGKPVSRIAGYRLFWGRDFVIDDYVLDPRPETETLVQLALTEPFARVLDIGTGTGCILLSLLADRPTATGVGTDVSSQALRVAGKNADAIGVASRVELLSSRWFQSVAGHFDLIVSNPPYIASAEMSGLQSEVLDHDPWIALTDDADGLSAYRALAQSVRNHLTDRGRFLVEIGPTQAGQVCDLFVSAGLSEIAVHTDLDGRDRVVSARNFAR